MSKNNVREIKESIFNYWASQCEDYDENINDVSSLILDIIKGNKNVETIVDGYLKDFNDYNLTREQVEKISLFTVDFLIVTNEVGELNKYSPDKEHLKYFKHISSKEDLEVYYNENHFGLTKLPEHFVEDIINGK